MYPPLAISLSLPTISLSVSTLYTHIIFFCIITRIVIIQFACFV